jgi:putative transposase
VAPHVLARHCAVTVPQVAWGGAGTSGWPEAGGWDTSVLVDVYARQVVGWAMSDSMETPLVTAALEMALGRRQPTAGRMHQSDRGAQYARQADRGRLAAQGIAWSLRGKGECWDKAVADRFLGSLKRERTAKRY